MIRQLIIIINCSVIYDIRIQLMQYMYLYKGFFFIIATTTYFKNRCKIKVEYASLLPYIFNNMIQL